jgi:bifunctional NMN adenylyltransferase/nudix hydrolase
MEDFQMTLNTTPKPYDYAVVIGRFNPCHLGHKALLDKAAILADRVIVLFGTSYRPSTIKNPFSHLERELMVMSMYKDEYPIGQSPFICKGIRDFMYNNQRWAMGVQNAVDDCIMSTHGDPDTANICLVGNNKDDSSWYLSMFPQWVLVSTDFTKLANKDSIMSATELRRLVFESDLTQTVRMITPYVHPNVANYLLDWTTSDNFFKLVGEHFFIKKYKESWSKAPYAPTFVCTDACVVQSGHVLMIQRRAEPGKGLWALPGGFLNQNETMETGMIRELIEETKIKVPEKVLLGSIKEKRIFDHPDRSLRGRTITQAYKIELPPGELPRVKGSDDALKARWIPFSDIKSEMCFDDHFDMLQELIGI